MINGTIRVQKDIIMFNVYISNSSVSKYMYTRQKLTELQREIDESTIILEDFNTLSKMDRHRSKKITFTKINHIMGHKTQYKEFKRMHLI